ncbi:alkaline phosphatase family protein [Micromonospora sp. FIMYZ51]|uniref:alkaline phosphatase family protein n=1 Tax=Micromonospora sp. FIMYZ51 TaxID=3051832 RepID=UPI00311DA5E2
MVPPEDSKARPLPEPVRVGLRVLRGYRPTIARLRTLVRSMVTSFVVLSATFWLLPGVTTTSLVGLLWLVVLVSAVGAVLRPLLLALATALGGLGALTIGVGVQAVVMYVALRLAPEAQVAGFGVAFAAAWLAVALAAIVNWLADAGTDDTFVSETLRLMSRVRRATGRRRRPLRRARRSGDPTTVDPPRGDPAAGPTPDGLLIIQLDGVATPVVQWAVRAGNLPTIGRWLRSGTHRMTRWHTGLPATTPAAQAGLLHGETRQVPAYRWYEKATDGGGGGRLVVSSRPRDAAEVERRISTGAGLLRDGGVSISTAFSGDAPTNLLTVSRAGLPGRSTPGYAAFMTSPYGFARTVVLGAGLVLRELHEARRRRVRGVQPRADRGGTYLALRPLASLLNDLSVSLIAEQMARGAPVIFCDFVDYDEVAHHAGPARPEAMAALEALDHTLGILQRLAAEATRRYHLVVLSDHGQSQGATFRQRYGESLAQLVDRLVVPQVAVPEGAPDGRDEAWGRVDALLTEVAGQHGVTAVATRVSSGLVRSQAGARSRAERDRKVGVRWPVERERKAGVQPPAEPDREGGVQSPVGRDGEVGVRSSVGRDGEVGVRSSVERERKVGVRSPAEPDREAPVGRAEPETVVVASGNLAMIYFTRHPGRLTRQRVEAVAPGLIDGLAGHPGIGLVVVDSDDGPVAIGSGGSHRLRDGQVDGVDPLVPYGPRARRDLLCHQEMAHVGDLVLISAVDPGLEEVSAFEELIGSHGGLGGWQNDALLIHPAELPQQGELVGPEAVHRQLLDWLRRLGLRRPDGDPMAGGPVAGGAVAGGAVAGGAAAGRAEPGAGTRERPGPGERPSTVTPVDEPAPAGVVPASSTPG